MSTTDPWGDGPGEAAVWRQRGLEHRDAQRMVEATAALARAETLAPDDLGIVFDHAQVRFVCGLPAAESLARVHAAAPDHLGVVKQLAAALQAEGAAERAGMLLEGTLAEHPDWLEGHKALSDLRWRAGHADGYVAAYAAAAAKQPRNVALRLAWFYAVAARRDWDSASRVLDAGERLGGADSYLPARLYVATESGDLARAHALIERTAAIEDTGLDICRMRHHLRSGRFGDAESVGLRLCRSPAGRHAWPYLSLAWRSLGSARAGWLDGTPPHVKIFDLQFSTAELDELATLLRTLHTDRAPHLEQSVRGGTQTGQPLFFRHEDILRTARLRIREAVAAYVAGLPPRDASHPLLAPRRDRVLFDGSWSVRLQSEGFHASHTHPAGWISSAFYVALPGERMGTPPAGWISFGAPPPELGLELAPYLQIQPKPARLVLFPSTMWHSTLPFDDGERLAIAFDVRGSAPGRD